VHPAHVLVQAIPPIHELGVNSLAIDGYCLPDDFQCVCHLLHHLLWRKVSSMENNRQVSKADLL
jgi:hypothetical protein